jgi:osmotically-inducible protein OsmY
MSTDAEIRQNVERQLAGDPDMEAVNIAVAVDNGSIQLTGSVSCYGQKVRAQAYAEQAHGDVEVANSIDVRLPAADQRTDSEIVRDAIAVLEKELRYTHEDVRLAVENGWITLDGDLEWDYQRTRAESAMTWIRGVTGVSSVVTVDRRLEPMDIARTFREKQQPQMRAGANSKAEAASRDMTSTDAIRSWARRETAAQGAGASTSATKAE